MSTKREAAVRVVERLEVGPDTDPYLLDPKQIRRLYPACYRDIVTGDIKPVTFGYHGSAREIVCIRTLILALDAAEEEITRLRALAASVKERK